MLAHSIEPMSGHAAPSATPPHTLVEGPVLRIGVFRALMLGDMLCAMPAMRALAAHWPQAEIVLIGLPWAKTWASRQSCIQHFIEFPGWPGLPEQCARPALLPHFLRRMQQERFDLLVQLHGSGDVVNPMVGACGARHAAGFAAPGSYSADPALHVQWPQEGQEILRLLAVTDHLGIPRRGLHMDWPIRPRDRAVAAELLPAGVPFACLHPGARFPSRRWPARHFAAVGDRLAREGFQIVITGSADEASLAAEVAAHMREPAINLAGRTDLWCLGAVVEAAAVVVTNDTGMSHVTAAVGTPSVVVSCGSDMARWAPLDQQRHLFLGQDLPCRPCMHLNCPLPRHECAEAIAPERVAAAAMRQAAGRMHACRPRHHHDHRLQQALPQRAR